MFISLDKEEKKLFIRDFVLHFILTLLKIIAILAAVVIGIVLLWVCINNPIYIPIPIAVIVFAFIFKAAKSEAIYRHDARERCKALMEESKQNMEDYKALKEKWEALTPVDAKQAKERESELSHCQHSFEYWEQRYTLALGEFIAKGGKFVC